ncbi:MAG: M55 family metallopeptidase [Candidatus Cloacimonetes bacterium]|jgi:D-amino peptidase|nr:M55 family metallopeptidase [Candidatus Cloacimonadota bacterium]MDY0337270.1 M55 family metallopeptidase [Candidatus Cloacimonadaceae bacterium]MDD2543254.1 M55 family metallopeptidase [Candidatus Cloacimonadota bacterium]MDD2682663.1 M55 family metallopeptidase [Candidatus Cloacimonadota bacterium]MDD3096179.1 M55 family metallopeptidase [Candidatus Cloacimonadota bacterium]
MKIYISVDMEGIPGTFNWDHEKVDRASVRNYMQDHVSCAIEAIRESKENHLIDEIVIADSHSHGDNLFYEITDLDSRLSLIQGDPRPCYMMPGFSNKYSMVFLLGYHAATGALRGNMDHTYSNSRIQNIWINGVAMSECLINSAYAGHFGVPVALVSGDLALQNQLSQHMPWIDFVCTKEGISKFAAKNYSRPMVRQKMDAAVKSALAKKDIPTLQYSSPVSLKIEFHSTAMADMACLMPRVERLDGKTIMYQDENYAVLFDAIMALITLAASTTI